MHNLYLSIIFFLIAFDYGDKRNVLDIFYGVGVGEVLILPYIVFYLLTSKFTITLHPVSSIKIILPILILITLPFKQNLEYNDVFEILRLILYALFIITIFPLRQINTKIISLFFVLGFDLAFSLNLMNQAIFNSNIAFGGFYQVEARNQSGAAISAMLLLSSYFLFNSIKSFYIYIWLFLVFVNVSFLLFVFSFGAWLGFLFIVPMIIRAFVKNKSHLILVVTIVIAISSYNYSVYDQIQSFGIKIVELIEIKKKTREGDSIYDQNMARIGNMYSSILIAIDNPLIGIAPSNWGNYNDQLRNHLGEYYHKNDNPHSGIFYLLSISGFFAFAVYVFCEFLILRLVKNDIYLTLGFIGVMLHQFLLLQYITTLIFIAPLILIYNYEKNHINK